MQKIRSFFIIVVSILIAITPVSPIFGYISWTDIYDYSEFQQEINISSSRENIYKDTISFDTPRTTFIFSFSGYTPEKEDDIIIEWDIDGTIYSRSLDYEPREEYESLTTFPFVTSARKSIDFTIRFHDEHRPSSLYLITSNQSLIGKKITFAPYTKVNALSNIVSRADW
jgi:hypothetical protein